MKKYAIVVVLTLFTYGLKAEVADSVGTKVKNGKVYILHKVEKGQGLYGISKRYGAKLTDLIAENPGSERLIKVDQVIWVPTDRQVKLEEPLVEDFFERTEGVRTEEPVQERSNETETFASYHEVVAGETLFAIAARYNTTVRVIKDLNGLDTDVLSIGQKLLVPSDKGTQVLAGDRTVTPRNETGTGDTAAPYQIDIEEERAELDVGIAAETTTQPELVVKGYSIKVTRLEEYDLEQVEESGEYSTAGESIPPTRYWAGHFNAPIGTVILVTNPANGKNVFVKVVENFERESESAVILLLSDITIKSIGLEDGQSVQLSYAR